MADAGIGEAALLAAAAEASAAGAATAGTVAATLPEVIGAGATLAGTGAAAAPVVAEAALPALAATVPTAAEAAATVAPVAAEALPATSLLPTAATTATEVPGSISLLATEAEPVTGAVTGTTTGATQLGPPTLAESMATQDIGFGAGNLAPGWSGYGALPEGTSLPATIGPGAPGYGSSGLLGQLGDWWSNATLGEKLKLGGTIASAGSTAAKAATPPPTQGPKRTLKEGQVGKPMSAQGVTQVIDALVKRRNAMVAQANAYRPRSLLG